MICKFCGREIADYSAFCTYCGKALGNQQELPENEQKASAPPPGYSDPIPMDGRMPDANVENTYGTAFNYSRQASQSDYPEDMLMNGTSWQEICRMNYIVGERGQHYGIQWLKFIMFFQIFATAFMCLVNAVTMFTGYPDMLRNYYPAVVPVEIFTGCAYLLMAGGFIVSRVLIARLRRLGVYLFFGLHILDIVLTLMYLLAVSIVTQIPLKNFLNDRLFWNIFLQIALLAANYVYFRHRRTVFIN